MTSILFICHGNYCRSPMAEATFRYLLKEKGLEPNVHVDSAGIGDWHIGKPPHNKTCEILSKENIPFNGICGRQVTMEDVENFDMIIVMDKKNLSSIRQLAGNSDRHIYLLTDFINESVIVEIPDPFHTGEFENSFCLIKEGCEGLLKTITSDKKV